jgi:hypothetical protein
MLDGRHDRPAIVRGEPAAFAAENARQVLGPVIFRGSIAPRCQPGRGDRVRHARRSARDLVRRAMHG